jgi:tetratricopeptide (TPR) repeat protein
MLLSLLLLMLAQNVQPAPVNGIAPGLPAAIQLVQEGRNAEALAALQKIVSENPNDHLTRLWIAKVHDQMGRPDLAEAVYRSIVLEDPQNVDALMGAGVAMMQLDQTEAAIDMLTRAEALSPQNQNVLSALGAAYALAGRDERSLTYYEKVEAISPTLPNRLALEGARKQTGNRFESQTYDEQYNGNTTATRGVDMAVNFRLGDTLRVFGRGQLQTKFSKRENRMGGGAEWRWKPSTTLTGQVLANSSNTIMPQRDYLGRLDYGYHKATWTAIVRYFDFFGANVSMASPGVTYDVTPQWTLALRYAYTSTTTTTVSGVQGNTIDLRAAHEIKPRIWARGGYIHGVDNFDLFTVDQIGNFKANTVLGQAQYIFPSLTSIVVTVSHQSREGGVHMNRFTVGLTQSF